MNFFLCDDDIEVHHIYSEKINKLCQKYNIACDITFFLDGNELLSRLRAKPTFSGIIILDINMPAIDGMNLAQELNRLGIQAKFIFLTVSKNHFLPAFDVGAYNYLVKSDTSDSRFEKVILKAISDTIDEEQEYIIFSNIKESRSIPIKDISYFEVDKRIVTVHYKDSSFAFFSSIGKLENQLLQRWFIRTHRSFLISIPHIESVSYTELKLRSGTVIPIGRTFYRGVKDMFNNFHRKSHQVSK